MSGLDDACCRLPRVRRSTDQPNVCWPGTRTKYIYDVNGNMTSRQGSTVAWTSYNYPTQINDTAASESVSFAYGPDRRAWKTATTLSGSTEQAYHVGGLLDVVINGGVTDYRHYIYAGAQPVAIFSRKSSGTKTSYYLFNDHQGSIAAITNGSGALVTGESFTAYGERRNSSTWSGSLTTFGTINGITRHGYTFQEALGSRMALNDMVGRVQDPITGRFLSADPVWPNASDPQSYNRYSYVDNNPLTYTDPTGFEQAKTQPVEAIYPDAPPIQGIPDNGCGPGVICVQPKDSDSPPIVPISVDPTTVGGNIPTIADGAAGKGKPAAPGNTKPPGSSNSGGQQTKPKGPANPYTCARFGIGCEPPPTECTNGGTPSVQNNPDLTSRIHTDMTVGADTGALIVAGVIAANIFGAPEVEGGEAALGILEGAKVIGVTGGVGAGVGASGGIIFAVATTPSTCP